MLLSEPVQAIADSAIPTLPAALDRIELSRRLEIFSLPPWRWGDVRDVQIRVLRFHRGQRCTMELVMRTTTGVHTLIGKLYAQDDGLAIYEAMERISQVGFGPEAEFSIPKPLALLPALHLLLQERVPGPPAEDVFLMATERSRIAAAERCARWLARFHAVAPKAGPVFSLNNYLSSLERWSRRIEELGEPLAGKARRLFHRLELASAALGPVEMCAGHGSYKPAQVILANGRTVTCDWDSYDVADPCRDVARFIVGLQRVAFKYLGSIRALDAVAEVFLRTYQALSPFEVATNLSWYRALTCLRLSKYEANRPVCTFREGIEALLGEGLRVLER